MLKFDISLTAEMDINNLRIALLNHIVSKQLDQKLLIEINDSNKEGKDKEILEILSLFNIDYTQVIYQSKNIKYHTQMAMKLLLDKKAFNCFCSEEALEEDRQKAKKEGKPYTYSGFCQTISDETKFNCNAPFVVRVKKPKKSIKFTDLVKGDCSYEPNEVDSFIILKHDKTPTDIFASSINEMLYDISIILRGDRYLANTPKQIHIRQSLGYDKEIQYIHIPDSINFEGNNSLSVKQLVKQGYLPVAIANYCVALGYDTPKEIFTIEEAIQWFDTNKISKEPIEFNREKLNFINKEHLKIMDELRLSKILGYADKELGKLGKIYLEECSTIKEIKEKIDLIFRSKTTLKNFEEEFIQIKESLSTAPFMNDLDTLQEYLTQKTALQEEKVSKVLYYLITGTKSGPDLHQIYPLIKNYLGEIIQ